MKKVKARRSWLGDYCVINKENWNELCSVAMATFFKELPGIQEPSSRLANKHTQS